MDLLRSLPIGSYLEQPVTWLHKVDPRVKFAWLMTFLIAPVLGNPWWRIGLAASLILLTVLARIPFRVWSKQIGWLLLLCAFLFLFSSVAPDTLSVEYQPRTPGFCADDQVVATDNKPNEVSGISECKTKLPHASSYRYVYFDQPKFAIFPRLTVTRRSLDIAVRISTLIFTLITVRVSIF